MITIQEHKQAVKEVEKLKNIRDSKLSKLNKDTIEIEDRYYKLIQDLKEKQREETNKINQEKNKFELEMDEQIKPNSEKINEFNRIIKLIETSKKDVDLNLEMYKYDYPRDEKGKIEYTKEGNFPDKERIYLKPLSILKDNEFCKIAVYIYENQKPKNKFTLGVVGRSIFDSKEILNFSWGYLPDISENGHFGRVLKDLPSVEELFIWWGKNQSKVFKDEINKIEEVTKEYQEVIKNTNTKEWAIAYLENRKDYYEKRVSGGTETKEYADVIQELTKLTKGKEKEKYTQIIKTLITNKLQNGN